MPMESESKNFGTYRGSKTVEKNNSGWVDLLGYLCNKMFTCGTPVHSAFFSVFICVWVNGSVVHGPPIS